MVSLLWVLKLSPLTRTQKLDQILEAHQADVRICEEGKESLRLRQAVACFICCGCRSHGTRGASLGQSDRKPRSSECSVFGIKRLERRVFRTSIINTS